MPPIPIPRESRKGFRRPNNDIGASRAGNVPATSIAIKSCRNEPEVFDQFEFNVAAIPSSLIVDLFWLAA